MSVGNDEVVTALYDYIAKDPEELSIRKNEQLTLLDSKYTWWKVRNVNSVVGLVPSNYLRREKSKSESLVNRIANKLPGKKGKSGVGNVTVGAGNGGGSRDFPTVMSPSASSAPTSNQMNEEFVSKFNYEATRDDEFTLTKGMRVLVIEKEGDGWWYGKNADQPASKPGWFPSNYVEKASTQPASNAAAGTFFQNVPPAKNDDCIMVVRTLYAFNSGNPEELAFEQNELLDIIEQPPEDPEWWFARNRDGETGLVPENYVEIEQGAQSISAQPNYDPVCQAEVQNGTGNLRGQSASSENNQTHFENEWYFGSIKRVDAEKMLGDRAKNGEFLVRDSETSVGDYSISMKMPGRMRHFKVTSRPDGSYGIGQRQFESMEALLEHYKHAPIYTSGEQGKVYLTNSMSR